MRGCMTPYYSSYSSLAMAVRLPAAVPQPQVFLLFALVLYCVLLPEHPRATFALTTLTSSAVYYVYGICCVIYSWKMVD